MKNSLYLVSASLFLAFNFTGCTLLPYEENFSCNKGLNSGTCQSVSENYRDTFIDKNTIPLTVKQKEGLIEQVESQGIIEKKYFTKDRVTDWDQLILLNRPRLKHILEVYKFDNGTTERIEKIISDSNVESNNKKVRDDKVLENEELFKYLRLRNEYLNEENLKLKNSK